ncbi:cobalt ABC transporter ATP-binding protein [Leucobacter sp. UCD-THU]|uniref:energy-coupling factor ABC transporter ATP-binding protein n=1 Tax=Leucobacter sp. UCD-THU TaxID=1292023 RepID=UPI000382702D|nr:energy-coupling factor ABC transporter ATP-binding protein [Leucobacter sp. UCD-THU]EYT54762.1 cobalt ABC transporter ATP-binding protein [Leucobacter sp. UCD-THU]
MIELRSATVTAPEGPVTILHPVSLTLTERRVSIIGANGSGKSTLARLVNGLVEPSAGQVVITASAASNGGGTSEADAAPGAAEASAGAPDPRPLDTRRDGAAVRRRVGFVFTDPAAQLIMPTAIEDVMLSLRRTHRDKRARREAALAALDRFGLAQLADRSVHTLSGGQKQLLAIASVLATDPAILVADEPTTLLDLRNARMIGDLLMSLPQQLVVVTHDLELAARADRTLVVDEGRVAFDGAPAAAIAHYRELSGAPAASSAAAGRPSPDDPARERP